MYLIIRFLHDNILCLGGLLDLFFIFGSPMEEGSDYYVVKKGDMVAVYKTLNDCQAQICSSVCDVII